MGTQQILLIVLSVIIVGAAIAVGIEMFNAQSYSANRSALAADAQLYGTMVIQYYKMPVSLGGAGQNFMSNSASKEDAAKKIGNYIGWSIDDPVYDNGADVLENENGIFVLTVSDDDDNVVYITAYGNEVRSDKRTKVVSMITFPGGNIEASVQDVEYAEITFASTPDPFGY